MYQRMLIDPSRKEDYIIDCSFEEYMTCSAILARYTSVRVWNGLLSSLSILSLIWSNWNVLIALMHFKDVPHIPSPIHLRMRRGIHRNSAACFTCQTMLHSVILSCVCVCVALWHTHKPTSISLISTSVYSHCSRLPLYPLSSSLPIILILSVTCSVLRITLLSVWLHPPSLTSYMMNGHVPSLCPRLFSSSHQNAELWFFLAWGCAGEVLGDGAWLQADRLRDDLKQVGYSGRQLVDIRRILWNFEQRSYAVAISEWGKCQFCFFFFLLARLKRQDIY